MNLSELTMKLKKRMLTDKCPGDRWQVAGYISPVKERVHSEMKISVKTKVNLNIVTFAFVLEKCFFFFRHQFRPHNITSAGTCNITSRDLHHHIQGPTLSPPGTCIITSKDMPFHLRDLHYHFQELHYCFRTCIFTSRTCIITSRTSIIASGPALFYRNLSEQNVETNRRKLA